MRGWKRKGLGGFPPLPFRSLTFSLFTFFTVLSSLCSWEPLTLPLTNTVFGSYFSPAVCCATFYILPNMYTFLESNITHPFSISMPPLCLHTEAIGDWHQYIVLLPSYLSIVCFFLFYSSYVLLFLPSFAFKFVSRKLFHDF